MIRLKNCFSLKILQSTKKSAKVFRAEACTFVFRYTMLKFSFVFDQISRLT